MNHPAQPRYPILIRDAHGNDYELNPSLELLRLPWLRHLPNLIIFTDITTLCADNRKRLVSPDADASAVRSRNLTIKAVHGKFTASVRRHTASTYLVATTLEP
jgi:hypothetical protein